MKLALDPIALNPATRVVAAGLVVRSSPSVSRDKPIRFDLIWRVGVYECYIGLVGIRMESSCQAFGSLSPQRSSPVPHRTCVTPHTRFHVT